MPPNSLRFGCWELKGKLGQGGFGEVQHWINHSTKQEIATKHIRNGSEISADQQSKLVQRWHQEHKWTREFKKPFIVSGITLGNDSSQFISYLNKDHVWNLPVIILEYCNGGDVRKLLQRPQNANGLLEVEVRDILNSLRQAVYFLHTTCKICHRDLKPDNIVIHRMANGQKLYKLTDFGLARDSPIKTISQSVVGTRHYYAPEVVDTGKYNNKVDYWSMGIIAFELATGVLPFIPHQNAITIHTKLKQKERNCIAITEDHINGDIFHFHNDIPIGHHLSKPWEKHLIKWLPLAVDSVYSRRGSLVATDEVQNISPDPAIFTSIERLGDIKVLTLFAACSFQRLEYEVTSHMTMGMLGKLIEKDTELSVETSYFVLPTGHPHRRLTKETTPIDLYVDRWCDTSEESGNPPVMVYIFNILEKCVYKMPSPSIPDRLLYYINSKNVKLKRWLEERLMLDMHHLLNTEQSNLRQLLSGFKEYAVSLEDEILGLQMPITALKKEKDKCCGAIEQFQTFYAAAQQEQDINLRNDTEWQTNLTNLISKHEDIVASISKIIDHYESTLRNVRNVSIKDSQEIYDNIMGSDIYKLKNFQRNYLQRGDIITCSELENFAINLAQARYNFNKDKKIENLQQTTHQIHSRFLHITIAIRNARENINGVQSHLLQLQLQMLKNAGAREESSIFKHNIPKSLLNFDAVNHEACNSLTSFDSLNTKTLIEKALFNIERLEDEKLKWT